MERTVENNVWEDQDSFTLLFGKDFLQSPMNKTPMNRSGMILQELQNNFYIKTKTSEQADNQEDIQSILQELNEFFEEYSSNQQSKKGQINNTPSNPVKKMNTLVTFQKKITITPNRSIPTHKSSLNLIERLKSL